MIIKKIAYLWLEDKKKYVKESTISAYYLLVINHIIPYFGNKNQIKEKHLQKFVLDKLNNRLNMKSIKDIVVVIKMIQKYGIKNKFIKYEELDIKYPAFHEKNELSVMAKKDELKLINYLLNNISYRNIGILICLFTGIRIGEICALKWCRIDIKNKTIRIEKTIERICVIKGKRRYTKLIETHPKTKQSNRTIPIASILYNPLKSVLTNVNQNNYVISNAPNPIEPRTFRSYYAKLLDVLKIPKIKFHGLRHTFATRCIENDCDYKTVSSILGHSNIAITLNLYVHPNYEEKKKCIEAMSKCFRKFP